MSQPWFRTWPVWMVLELALIGLVVAVARSHPDHPTLVWWREMTVRYAPIVQLGLAISVFATRELLVLVMWVMRSWQTDLPNVRDGRRTAALQHILWFPLSASHRVPVAPLLGMARIPAAPGDDGWRERRKVLASNVVQGGVVIAALLIASRVLLQMNLLLGAAVIVWNSGRVAGSLLELGGMSPRWIERETSERCLAGLYGVVRRVPLSGVRGWRLETDSLGSGPSESIVEVDRLMIICADRSVNKVHD